MFSIRFHYGQYTGWFSFQDEAWLALPFFFFFLLFTVEKLLDIIVSVTRWPWVWSLLSVTPHVQSKNCHLYPLQGTESARTLFQIILGHFNPCSWLLFIFVSTHHCQLLIHLSTRHSPKRALSHALSTSSQRDRRLSVFANEPCMWCSYPPSDISMFNSVSELL